MNITHLTPPHQHTINTEVIIPQVEENQVLYRIDDDYTKISEMRYEEREFLNSLILRNKPKKLLEIGVSAGASSIVMLNAIKDFSDATLYSIDYSDNWYKSANLKTGYMVDKYVELKVKWRLYTGALSLRFLNLIGKGIDFCLIDTVHYNPGEILDFLMILPYLKEDAIIIFHDINHHTSSYPRREWSITNNLLMSTIFGKKFLQGNFSRLDNMVLDDMTYFPNIGGIKINKDTRKYIFEIFNLLTIKWTYLPKENEQLEIISFFEKNYDTFYINYLKDVFMYQKICHEYHKKEARMRKTAGYWVKKVIKKIARELKRSRM
jgi:predicted O-methyltransferase YrrM